MSLRDTAPIPIPVMSIDKATDYLTAATSGYDWFTAVGVGADSTLYLYVNSIAKYKRELAGKRSSLNAGTFHGYRVVVKKMSRPRPLRSMR